MRQNKDRRAREEAGDESAAPRANLYEEVTTKIIAQLERGCIPWVQPWGTPNGQGATATPGLPRNAVTGRNYSGVNVLLLWGALFEHGYSSQGWLTFRQAQQAGGCVRKGEHGITVVYADRFTPKAEKERARESGEDARSVSFLKRFTVFNLAQCEGLCSGLAPDPEPLPEREIVPVAEEVITASGVDFRIGGNKAFYVPSADYVQVPPQPAFHEQINYYRTALHELTHAVGHPSRLNRNQAGSFGSKDYAKEELVAEMGSAFLCASLGIIPTVRHADYIASWLDILRDDNRAIFRAGSAASKAADWLLTRHAERQAEQGTYIDLHRHAAVRAALTRHPKMALRLMVAHAITGSPLWNVKSEPQTTRNDDVRESVETCRGETDFDEKRRAVLSVLGFSAEEPTVTGGNGDGYGLVSLFLRLLDLSDRAVMDVIACLIGETMAAGSAAVEAVGQEIGVDMARYWQADDVFFGLIRDKEVLTALVAEVAGDVVAQANKGEKTKTLKRIVRDHLAGADGRAKVENWVPRWMAFPPSAYTARGGVGTVEKAQFVAAARIPDEPDPSDPGPSEPGNMLALPARAPEPEAAPEREAA